MYKKDIKAMKKSMATKFLKIDKLETTIKINPSLILPDATTGKDKRPSKKVSRAKRKGK